MLEFSISKVNKTMERFGVLYTDKVENPYNHKVHEGSFITIPTSSDSNVTFTVDDMNHGEKLFQKGERHAFNIECIKTSETPVFIFTSELDAFWAMSACKEAIAIPNNKCISQFRKRLSYYHPKYPMVICGKGDVYDGIEDVLTKAKVPYEIHIFKDPGERILYDEETIKCEIETVENDIMRKVHETLLGEINEHSGYNAMTILRDKSDEDDFKLIPTGFEKLDTILNEGLPCGLICIGAMSSVGKTTFCLQMADAIAESGTDVLFFSLEMSTEELVAKSLSRLTYIISYDMSGNIIESKTCYQIRKKSLYKTFPPEEYEIIEKAYEDYAGFSKNIYFYEGFGGMTVNNIRQIVESHCFATGKTPVVIVDYVQIIAPLNVHMDDKQNVDRNVVSLKQLSRDLNTPVIAISSFNREGYHRGITTKSFKESGGIEYSADVLMGLQYNGIDDATDESQALEIIKKSKELAKRKIPQEIQVKVMKNRNGSIDDYATEFDAAYNYFGRIEDRK